MQNKSRKPPKCISSDLVQTLFSQGFRKFWIFFLKNFLVNFSYLNLDNLFVILSSSKQKSELLCLLAICPVIFPFKMDSRWPLFRMTFFVTSDHRNVIGNFRNGPVGIMVQFSYYIMTSNHYKSMKQHYILILKTVAWVTRRECLTLKQPRKMIRVLFRNSTS